MMILIHVAKQIDFHQEKFVPGHRFMRREMRMLLLNGTPTMGYFILSPSKSVQTLSQDIEYILLKIMDQNIKVDRKFGYIIVKINL